MTSPLKYDSLSHEELIELGQSQQSEIQSLQHTNQSLQSDYQSLSGQYELMLSSNQSLQAANQNLEFKVTALTHELSKLKKLIFGSRSERFIPAEDNTARQGVLDLGIDPIAEPTAVSQQITYNRTAVTAKPIIHPGRSPLPEHLHREVIVIEPAEDTTGAVKIGEEVTEVLELQEQKLYVKRFVRPRYLLKGGEQTAIVIAAPPCQPLPKCIAGPGLLAQVVIDKYCDHCVP